MSALTEKQFADEMEGRFKDLVTLATRREVDITLKNAKRNRVDETEEERKNGHYIFRVRKGLVTFGGPLIGALILYAAQALVGGIHQGDRVDQQTKVQDQMQKQMVTRDVFDATIKPMNEHMGSIDSSLAELKNLRKTESQDQVIYKTFIHDRKR
jgi:hypothetical protein